MASNNMNNVHVSPGVLSTYYYYWSRVTYINSNSKFYITSPEEVIVQSRSVEKLLLKLTLNPLEHTYLEFLNNKYPSLNIAK